MFTNKFVFASGVIFSFLSLCIIAMASAVAFMVWASYSKSGFDAVTVVGTAVVSVAVAVLFLFRAMHVETKKRLAAMQS